MNRTLRTDLLREIRRSLGRYLSIAAIVALGVAFFAGIKASPPDMEYSADDYFDRYHLQDIQIFSSIGLDEEDLDAIRKVEGVEDAQGQFQADFLTRQKSRELTVRVLSYQDNQPLNTPRLVEGRMPENEHECLIQGDTATGELLGSYPIGSKITLLSGDDKPVSNSLRQDTFTIVGKAYSPNYLSYELGASTVGSGSVDTFLYVPQSAVASELFTEIDLSVQRAREINSYTQNYFDVVEPVVDRVEAIADSRLEARIAAMNREIDDQEKEAKAQLDDGQKQLDEARKKLEDAKAQLDASAAQIESSAAQLQSADAQIASGQSQIAAGQAQVSQSLPQVEAGIARIQQAASQLPALQEQKSQIEAALGALDSLETAAAGIQNAMAGIETLQNQIAALEAADPDSEQLGLLKAQLEQAQGALAGAIAQIPGVPAGSDGAAALAAIEQAKASILQPLGGSRAAAAAALKQVEDGIAQIQQAQTQLPTLQSARAQLQASQNTIDQKSAELNAAIAQKENGTVQLENGKTQLAQGQAEYEKGLEEYNRQKAQFDSKKKEAEEKIADARKQISDLKPEWYVLDRDSHYSYRDYQACADRMDGIASVFPVFFFLVAALVCMTTMTRMVDEQRNEMGTLKALGYSKRQIAAKYLLYAGSASIVGSIIGCAVGMVVFPKIIYSAWNIVYNLEDIQFAFQPGLMLLAGGSVTGVVLLATIVSIWKELREVPAQLMRPKAAKAGKRILLERAGFFWKRLSFMQKVTLRNLFRYKKRLFMTVIGISGCSALLLAGFGLNDSISDIVPRQFGAIYHFNAQITADPGTGAELAESLRSEKGVVDTAAMDVLPVTVRYDHKDVSASLDIVSDPAAFEKFMSFLPLDGSKPMHLEEGSALLSVKTAEKLSLKKGDTLTFQTADRQKLEIPVGGIFEQYVDHHIYITRSTFEKWHLDKTPDSTVLVMTASTDPEAENELGTKIMEHPQVKSLTFYTSMIDSFLNMISSIKTIVVVLVLSAAMLAFVVLYNLSNVNISERMREIATIKVLGFTDREVSSYVNRESLLLAIIGGAVGLVLGIYLHSLIMNLAEMDTIRFGRTIFWQSYVYSMALTLLFAIAVGWIMNRRLKKIEMVESLKAVE